jgi:hypothetical protein
MSLINVKITVKLQLLSSYYILIDFYIIHWKKCNYLFSFNFVHRALFITFNLVDETSVYLKVFKWDSIYQIRKNILFVLGRAGKE